MDQQWEQLRQRCLACRACSLAQERTQVVFGVGDPAAEVLLVGEAPGANEDKQGEPFVGRAGKLLDDMLQMIGLSRERIYITNSVKCRPPQNRDPLNTEKEACSGYLRRQMELMQPKILVCLGRISAMELIKADFRITQEHGQFFRQDGIEKMAMYHPAALLRDPGKKPETFEDLKRLQAKIREICVRTKLDFSRRTGPYYFHYYFVGGTPLCIRILKSRRFCTWRSRWTIRTARSSAAHWCRTASSA